MRRRTRRWRARLQSWPTPRRRAWPMRRWSHTRSHASSFVRSFRSTDRRRYEVQHAGRFGRARDPDEDVDVRVRRDVFDVLGERRARVAMFAIGAHDDEPRILVARGLDDRRPDLPLADRAGPDLDAEPPSDLRCG